MKIEQLARHASQRALQEVREFAYINAGVDLTRPQYIRGMVNERCNYKCRYCGFWQQKDYLEELSIDEWKQALRSLKDFIGPAPFAIQFSGGEPFVKKGFIDLLHFCHDNRIDWGVITNGSALTPRTIERTVAAAPLNIDISVDSNDAEIHDHSRGIPGSFARIEGGIRTLRDARAAAHKHFLIRIKPTVHANNLASLPDLVRWTQDVGATSIDFAPVRPWVPEASGKLWIKNLPLLDRIIDELIEMKHSGAPIENTETQLRSYRPHFANEMITPAVTPCRVGLRDFHIMPNGNVRTCWFYPVVGNVKDATAEEIWRSDTARLQRQQTTTCDKMGSVDCANSCLSHRTVSHDARRSVMLLKRSKALLAT